MKYLKLYLRLFMLCLVTLGFFIVTLCFYWFLPRNIWAYVLRAVARSILFSAGVKVIFFGEGDSNYLEYNKMVVSNHVSWLDIPVMYSIKRVNFIGRQEIKRWPLLNLLIYAGGTIYIDRRKKRDILRANVIVSDKLKNGAVVGLFPEGTTSDGVALLPFKSSLLESAIMADSEIMPIVIEYFKKNVSGSLGDKALEVTYKGDINLWQTVSRSLLLDGIIVHLTKLPSIKASDYSTRDNLAFDLYQRILTVIKK
ncbi:MAG: 1-acyl-sn-glycerol-3-phosphate acyltransferase [Proteobacteria bacterium]|jgi:1-acyl-sn-glycerol-3-phosphate acyltransferase|nr:1-acyl-sn-glycerol-3-phosphate acyltransferase [Pseudomonadota bacterium]